MKIRTRCRPLMILAPSLIAGCGGGGGGTPAPTMYTLGGTVSGLTVGGLVLANGSATLPIGSGATSFTFSSALPAGSAYAVTVKTSPTGFSCTVTNGSGTASANVQNVAVSCQALTYTLGGAIQGLISKGLVLANGSDQLTVASGSKLFTMLAPVAYSSAYSISVVIQPDGLNCKVVGGSGTMPAADVATVQVSCALEWTWIAGSQTAYPAAVYGTQGVPNVANVPSGRFYSTAWTDRTGKLWLFGGGAFDGSVYYYLNDLWSYDPAIGEWTWVSGAGAHNANGVYGSLGNAAPGSRPGARGYAVSWTDNAGNLWLFGGFGYDSNGGNGSLNDLWRFSPASGLWTWMGGSSLIDDPGVYGTLGTPDASYIPSSRSSGVAWTDVSGKAWLFGGVGPSGSFNDLWRYDPGAGLWTWVNGSHSNGAVSVYGTQGVPAPGNVPGSRIYAVGSSDAAGNLWLFGGSDTNPALNDLWKYNIAGNVWTWVSGKNGGGGTASYGALGIESANNMPGPRSSALMWTGNAGDLWLFGGFGQDAANSAGGFLNDLWRFDPVAGQWIWMSGSNTAQVAGVYGTLGVPSSSNIPPVRDYSMGWKDDGGNFWLMGGQVWSPGGAGGYFNDLWRF